MSKTTSAIITPYKLLIFDWEGTLARAGSQLFDGVIETLNYLKKNYLLGVATNRDRASLNDLLSQTNLMSYFAATRCADETALKPDPLMLQEILIMLKTPAIQAVMIGDSEADFCMAHRAGMASIAALYSGGKASKIYPSQHELTDICQLITLF